MQEKLRRCGIRSIDAVVDVTNYVLLELGQPMHAFDFDKLQGGIVVRNARQVSRWSCWMARRWSCSRYPGDRRSQWPGGHGRHYGRAGHCGG